MGRRKKKPFDEVFKSRAKRFFEKFATVKTEYEILRTPRRIDMLIIETDKPIKEHAAFFQYFQKFNIIEFKSEVDPFQIDDLYKIGYYCNAFLLKEKQATIENTTFTLVSTIKSKLLFSLYKPKKVRKGLYCIKRNQIIDIYVVIPDELGNEITKDFLLLKTFASKKYRETAILKILQDGSEEEIEDLYLLYKEEVENMSKRKPFDRQALLRKNVLEVAISCGIAEELEHKGIEKGIEQGIERGIEKGTKLAERRAKFKAYKEKLKTAMKMKKKGLDIDFILSIIDEIDANRLERFLKRFQLPTP